LKFSDGEEEDEVETEVVQIFTIIELASGSLKISFQGKKMKMRWRKRRKMRRRREMREEGKLLTRTRRLKSFKGQRGDRVLGQGLNRFLTVFLGSFKAKTKKN
jgi:hypothetical protein